ncbi:uncharacterized protein LOC130762988 isoform X1 [Actinidia eriantha]|uniref:uncharacterized protein LOC130762988 isoform X1 n=1 Tax=Actinidia eriantha TaxID=165200 RepID=UPI0025887F1B|nr:uncharacterized protein LOC130762988 isoform X1 [Actinidia eriantha]
MYSNSITIILTPLSLSLSKMKFLLELVTCCTSGSSPSRAEETLALAPPEDRRRKRERSATAVVVLRSRSATAVVVLRSRSAVEWRPSLCSISEDNMTAERERERERVILAGSERMIKRKVGSTTTGKVHVRSHSDDFGRSGFSTIMPTFSPTPFFF